MKKSRRIASFLDVCQVQTLRNSRRIASLLMLSSLSSSKNCEEVSQNSCVLKLADRQIDRWIDR